MEEEDKPQCRPQRQPLTLVAAPSRVKAEEAAPSALALGPQRVLRKEQKEAAALSGPSRQISEPLCSLVTALLELESETVEKQKPSPSVFVFSRESLQSMLEAAHWTTRLHAIGEREKERKRE